MASKSRRHRLIEIEWPEFGLAACPPPPSASELEARIDNLRARMEELKITHTIVYGDREHFANLAYLTGFDPRFEESLLIVGRTATPLILVGNECEAYLGISSLHNAGRLRHERFQSFSLLGQPRDRSRAVREILAGEGIGPAARVGAVGYKYFSNAEHPDAAHALDIPSYIADTLRNLAGSDKVFNATDLHEQSIDHEGWARNCLARVSKHLSQMPNVKNIRIPEPGLLHRRSSRSCQARQIALEAQVHRTFSDAAVHRTSAGAA
jgi:hypothetical protein